MNNQFWCFFIRINAIPSVFLVYYEIVSIFWPKWANIFNQILKRIEIGLSEIFKFQITIEEYGALRL